MKESEILQDALKDFLGSSPQTQASQLIEFLDFIKVYTKPEALNELISKNPFQTIAEEVTKSALETRHAVSVTRGRIKELKPWEGATIIVINNEGDIQAAVSVPVGRVYEKYPMEDLYFGALRKAVLSACAPNPDGLENPQNITYFTSNREFEGKLVAGVNLFRGEVQIPVLGQKDKEGVIELNRRAIVAVSGCSFQYQYLSTLHPSRHYGIDTLAGLAERAFAERFAEALTRPWGPNLVDELPAVKLYRASN